MNEIINAIPEYVITAVVSTAIFYLMNAGKNLLHSKVQHAKTTQSKELWSFIEQVANMAVNSLVSKNITGDAKFAQATAIVQDALAKQGFTNVDVKSIESAVQSAYEKSPLTPTSNEKPYVFKGLEQTKLDKPKVQDNVNNTQPIESK
ncbi:phage holin, LLH family [Limosilactobacillus vaginalis]|uniref:phage holin, LLH family n=1 Tax=Limosilactobacillus vaginalis TaxID=1633 RepID=UPI0024BA4788|nr:phage holin, LLH family [Limosilactobacillus vaginalis]